MLMQKLNKMIYFSKANKDIQLARSINLLDCILKNLDHLKFLGTHLYWSPRVNEILFNNYYDP